MNDVDRGELLAIFVDESAEQIATLESRLLTIDPALPEPGAINEAFRAAHTLKGASATMGFDSVAALAHELEDRLEVARGGSPLAHGEREALLALVDDLRRELQAKGPNSDSRRFTVKLDSQSVMKGVRAEILLRAIEEHASILSTVPERPELDHEEFEVTLASSESDAELERIAMSVPEVREWKPVAESNGGATQESHRPEATVRVPVSRLDQTVDLAGELIIERARLQRIVGELVSERSDDPLRRELLDVTDRLTGLAREMQELAMRVRMLPIDGAFRRLVRLSHDLAAQLGKQVEVRIEGGETEVDRSVLDLLGDPLIHMLRNAIDHGLETTQARRASGKPSVGTITLRASIVDGDAIVEIEDDGRGIDPADVIATAVNKGVIAASEDESIDKAQAYDLIFQSGFSTSNAVTEVSGRGVGLDIVRTNLAKVGGRVQLTSEVGRGTRFSVHVPVSLSIVRCLLVAVDGETYAIPEPVIVQTAIADDQSGVVDLAHMLEGRVALSERPYAVTVRSHEGDLVLGVDRLVAEEDLVVKPLATWLDGFETLAGAAIGADGRIVLIVDAYRLVSSYAAMR